MSSALLATPPQAQVDELRSRVGAWLQAEEQQVKGGSKTQGEHHCLAWSQIEGLVERCGRSHSLEMKERRAGVMRGDVRWVQQHPEPRPHPQKGWRGERDDREKVSRVQSPRRACPEATPPV